MHKKEGYSTMSIKQIIQKTVDNKMIYLYNELEIK